MSPLEAGSVAPDFVLRDQHGQDVSLSSFRGDRDVLLVFYPWAFSRVCTGELRELRELLPRLDPERVALLAVSCDPMFSLRAFAETDGLAFPLLSDFWPHGAVARAFGVFDEKTGAAKRSSFVLDRDGVVRWAVHNAIPDARSVGEYVEVLAGLRR